MAPNPSPTLAPTVLPSARTTATPSFLPNNPTPGPTVNKNPTAVPTPAPSMMQFCPPFSVSDTNNAQNPLKTAQCMITICPGQQLTIGGCVAAGANVNGGLGCFGDSYLRLYNSQGSEVASNDDSCGSCASISYSAKSLTACGLFTLRQGCFSNYACSGTTSIVGGAIVASMNPTASPTPSPLVVSLPPTPRVPTVLPSPMPTEPVQTCPLYGARYTNGDTENFQACGIYACAGSSFTVSTCSSGYGGVGARCTGDTILTLFDADDNLVVSNDDGPAGCGLCSQFTFTAGGPCQTYIVREGCKGDSGCTGVVVVADVYNDVRVQSFAPSPPNTPKPSRLPTLSPTLQPTRSPTLSPTFPKGAPTPNPTIGPTAPTAGPTPQVTGPPVVPTAAPTSPLICPPFVDLLNTQNALTNYTVCSIDICPGASVTISGCPVNGGYCVGDEFLRLYDSSQTQVAFNDDADPSVAPNCGKCSAMRFSFPDTTTTCQTYHIVQGCTDRTTCGGTTTIIGSGTYSLTVAIPTSLPTLAPVISLSPTYLFKRPTPRPTSIPTFLPVVNRTMTCNPFQVGSTMTDTINFATCGVYMCAGATVTVSTCSSFVTGASCTGNTYLRLRDSTGRHVSENADGPPGCGSCSQMTYTATSGCQTYIIEEGCQDAETCSGTVGLTGIDGSFRLATFTPTASPTSLPPTAAPSDSPTYTPGSPTPAPTPTPSAPSFKPSPAPTSPTSAPTPTPTLSQYCPPFSVANTNSALDGPYATCVVQACGGSTLTLGNCDLYDGIGPGDGCSGDQFFRLYDSSGINIASSDDSAINSGCGTCARIVYNVPPTSGCQLYFLREGCVQDGSCAGSVDVSGGVVQLPVPSRNPIPVPSFMPTPYVDSTPTTTPSTVLQLPTSSPSLQPIICPAYFTTKTNGDKIDYDTCGIYACPGDTFTVSTCSSTPGSACIGDTYLQLWDASGTMVIENDDGDNDPSCGACSQFTFSTTGPCQTYVLREGCAFDGTCGGTVAVSAIDRNLNAIDIIGFAPTQGPTINRSPTLLPTVAPTFGPPTLSPTYLPGVPTPAPSPEPTSPTLNPTPRPSNPTANPTLAPTFAFYCPPYDVTNTNNALQNYAICSFYACPGVTVVVGNCDGRGGPTSKGTTGDTWIRMFDSIGYSVAENDDGCSSGDGSQIIYTIPKSYPCQVFSLHEGCFGEAECGGVIQFVADSGIVLQTITPSQFPTVSPTINYLPSTPTLSPAAATPSPSAMQVSVTCNLFQHDPSTPYQDYPFCGFYACPGTTVTLSTCPGSGNGAFCTGNMYMKLYDSAGNLAMVNTDGPASSNCGGCPQITMTTSNMCQVYTVKEGCQGGVCSGKLNINGQLGTFSLATEYPTMPPVPQPSILPVPLPSPPPTTTPTAGPTELPDVPTQLPTLQPSSKPTFAPTGPTPAPTPMIQWCPQYTGNYTFDAVKVPISGLCAVRACPGDKLVFGDCDDSRCFGDQVLRLYDPSDNEVAFDDDSCGLCSQINYMVPNTPASCGIFTLHMGCFDKSACSGIVSMAGGTLAYIPGTPTLAPSVVPSVQPTPAPSVLQTDSPTTDPTPQPTTLPSQEPTPVPTHEPSPQPTIIPTPAPSSLPTEPSAVPTALPTTGPGEPSAIPTIPPTPAPSSVPSTEPTPSPSTEPTPAPSTEPTPAPSAEPSPAPSAEPSPAPSAEPTASPTPIPSSAPTIFQTAFPTTNLFSYADTVFNCPPYQAVNTASATNLANSDLCQFYMSPGNEVAITDCYKRGIKGAQAIKHTVLSLVVIDDDGSVTVLEQSGSTNDVAFQCDLGDNCFCSEIHFKSPSTPTDGQIYTIVQGCEDDSDCGGTVAVLGIGGVRWVTPTPTERPSSSPTFSPRPTLKPTRSPTAAPTLRPTPRPPTSRPTSAPTTRPTANPTPRPSNDGDTWKPTRRWSPTRGPSFAPTKSSVPTISFVGSDVFRSDNGSVGSPNPIWGDEPTGEGWGTALTWSGLNFIAGAPTALQLQGIIEVYTCTIPDSTAGMVCDWKSTVNGPQPSSVGSAVNFGFDVQSVGDYITVSAPGVAKLFLYTITSLLGAAAATPVSSITGPSKSVEFGKAVAFCGVPGGYGTNNDFVSLILAISDRSFKNEAKSGRSTGIVYIYTSTDHGTNWLSPQKITSPTLSSTSTQQDYFFGDQVAMNSLGLLAIGVGGSGIVYLYDCIFEEPCTCIPLIQSVITPQSPLPLVRGMAVYSLAMNKDMLVIGEPSLKTQQGAVSNEGSVLLYGLVDISSAPSAMPTVAPSRLASTTGSPTSSQEAGYFDNKRFQLLTTLYPDPADSTAQSPAFFGGNIAVSDSNILAVGAPGGANGLGTTYIYHCSAGVCDGKGTNVYFQKLICDSMACQQGAAYFSAMALSETGAILAKGNEGASRLAPDSKTLQNLGNVQIWHADSRIPLTFAPTPLPTVVPTVAPTSLPTAAPSSDRWISSAPTPTRGGWFNCSFTVIQDFTGPSLDINAVKADLVSIKQVLQQTIADMLSLRFGMIKVNRIIPVTDIQRRKRLLARMKDPISQRRALTSSVPMIEVNYTVTFNYLELGYADKGYYAAYLDLADTLRKRVSEGTAVNDPQNGLVSSFTDESWFTQDMRLNAPDMSALKSAESAYLIEDIGKLFAGTRDPTSAPTPRPTESPTPEDTEKVDETAPPTNMPSVTVEAESTGQATIKHNVTLISGLVVGIFFAALLIMYLYRQWVLGNLDSKRVIYDDDEKNGEGYYNDEAAVNPIYNNNGGPSRVIVGDAPDGSGAFAGPARRASGWNGGGPVPGPGQGQDMRSSVSSDYYLDEYSNPGFGVVRPASAMPLARGSISRLSPGGSPMSAFPQAPTPPRLQVSPALGPPGQMGLPQNLPPAAPLRPFAPPQKPQTFNDVL